MAAHLRGLSREPLDALPVCQRLRDTLQQKLSIETLTRIQSESIPMLLSGRDTLVQSQTGSGKTLCYLVPLLEKLQAHTSLNLDFWGCSQLSGQLKTRFDSKESFLAAVGA